MHTAAYWLMLAIRDAIPKIQDLAKAEFKTLRQRLLKIAARIIEIQKQDPHRLRNRVPRCRAIPWSCDLVAERWPITRGAACLSIPKICKPSTSHANTAQSADNAATNPVAQSENRNFKPNPVNRSG